MGLRQGELLIGDHNHQQVMASDKHKGYVKRNRMTTPMGSLFGASAFDQPLIPRSEWSSRIAAMKGSLISDLLLQKQIPSENQQQTNYCWCNAVITMLTTLRCVNGQTYVPLSPASVAAPVTGYSNVGGWGGQALDYIVKNGVSAVKFWPHNAIDRQYNDTDSQANRKLHMVTSWWDLPANNFDAVMTCLLLRWPVAIGLAWWSHEVCAVDPVEYAPGKFGVRFRNSWGDDYGNHGFNTLTEEKATPDDACCIRRTTASNE